MIFKKVEVKRINSLLRSENEKLGLEESILLT